MGGYFDKIHLEIFYPDFDNGYDKKIASIHYQVTYPDLNGNPVLRTQCFMNSLNDNETKNLELAVWSTSSKYDYMGFNFLKPDKPNANLTISRTIFYNPAIHDKPQASQISINTDADNVNGFKINAQPAATIVHNKIAIAIGEVGINVPGTANFYNAKF